MELLVALLFVLFGIVGAFILGIAGFLLGVFFGPIGLIIAALMRKVSQQDSAINSFTSARFAHREEVSTQASLESKWELLKRADADILLAAKEVSLVAPGLEDMLRDKYLLLGEKRLLRPIVDLVVEDWTNRSKSTASENRAVQEYLQFIGPEKYDRWQKGTVRSVDEYHGSWRAFNGGVLVQFDDGRVLISHKSYSRIFSSGDNSWI